ncbi:MAG: iron-containing alcohol dehydrogenase [Chloroflexi bacterium]|nr:iron-containing alcohol dehydrogenase [Chloroflexota bacterium]
MDTQLRFDPGLGEAFWKAVQAIPAFPRGEEVRLRRMIFESNALERLPEILSGAGVQAGAPLLVVMDETSMQRGGDDLKPLALAIVQRAGWSAEAVVVKPDATGQVHTDFGQIDYVQSRLSPGSAVLSVGSGTITDIAKHACHRFEQDTGALIPLVVYQTANSVSAYTSNMAPTFVDGVKHTLSSRYPDALVCDLETLRDAPYAMTAAGVGDLLAAGVSFADWYLAYSLGLDDAYTPLAETLMGPLSETLLYLAEQVRARDLQAMAVLAKLIALAGLSMSLSHATTPLSGFEHVISHVLDMTAEAAPRPLAMHGAQVALAAVRVAASYEVFLRELNPTAIRWEACFPEAAVMRSGVADVFASIDPTGRVAEECWRDFAIKLEAWQGRRADLSACLADWPGIRGELTRRVWPVRTLRRIIRSVGLPEKFEDLVPPIAEVQARQAFLSAHWIRRRFTLGDSLFFLGWDRQALWDRAASSASAPE